MHFSAKLNFKIEDNTLKAIVEKKNLLNALSNERLDDYFDKIVFSKYKCGIDYINKYDLFEFVPKYKKLLSLVDDFEKDDLKLAYYFKFNEYFNNEKELKKKIESISYLIDNKFDNYSIYEKRNELPNYFNLLKNMGYDIVEIKNKLDNLKIKDEGLALNNIEIAKMYKGKEIKEMITLVTKAILDNKIKNDREEILKFLKSR